MRNWTRNEGCRTCERFYPYMKMPVLTLWILLQPHMGVTYVQYLQPHWDVVLAAVQEYISSCPIKSELFPDGPILIDGRTSQTPTLQDGTVQSSPHTVAAPGRFDSIIANTPASSVQSRPSRQSIPTSIDLQVKSYSDALRSTMSANRHSSADDLSVDGTVTTGNTSKKSAREVKLEKENAELKAVIYNLKELQRYFGWAKRLSY